jgi:hypothetical protein
LTFNIKIMYYIAQSVKRRARGWTAVVQFLTGPRDFSLLNSVQTDSGAHPASYTTGTEGSFPVSKAAGA